MIYQLSWCPLALSSGYIKLTITILRSDCTSSLCTAGRFGLGSPAHEAPHNVLNCQSVTLGLLLRTVGCLFNFWESVLSFQIT